MIEMDRALKMQDATWTEGGDFQVRGDYVLVFTDETYLHQNHSPLTSWVDETRLVGKTSSKGKRLIVFHAVTRGDEAEVSTGPGLYFLLKLYIYIYKEGFLKHRSRV
jgi:hypothetical protein